MKFKPRDYQVKAHDAIFNEWKDVSSTALILPTGCGKTCVFATVVKTIQPMRAMVVAHREELIWQARKKISDITELDCGVEMGEITATGNLFGESPVIISTIQTQNSAMGDRKRMGKFDPKQFGVLVIDECHHATASSYKALIHYYKHNNPDIRILGVTATPDRSDEEALGQVFDTVAFDYEILDAIHDGWLVPVQQQFVSIAGLDFSSVRTTAGDLNGADLNAVMESESNMQGVAGASVEILGNRRGIVFTASVKQAEVISNIFNRHKAGSSDWICGLTPKDDRRTILQKFSTGQTQIICNCGVLTEGFDDPGVEVIIMARPTKSRSLYAQMAGRGTRPWPGLVDSIDTEEGRRDAIAASPKPACLIVDFVGNSGKHKLMTTADILGGKISDAIIQRAVAKAKKSGQPVRMDEAIDEEEQEQQRQAAEERRLAEEARKSKLVAKVNYSAKVVSPFDVLQISPVKERGWDKGRVLSEAQKAVLLRQGINPDTIPYSQGRQLLTEMFRRLDNKLATLKQMKTLARFGYTDPNLKFSEASNLIDQLARNGWRK